MNRLVRLLACSILFIIPVETNASDSTPQPTTSPTNSGKAATLKSIPKGDIDRFNKARESILDSIKEFNALATKSKSEISKSDERRLKAILGDIAKNSRIVREHSLRLGDLEGESLAGQLIIDDDITGKQASVQSTAKILAGLGDRLGLLEPVVYR